jgi:predicted nucleotide-binding protein
MYYHVLLKRKKDKFYGECKTDLTREQLIARFIDPYDTGRPIMLNGTTVMPEEIERITVTKSGATIESYIPKIKQEDQNSSVAIIGGPSYTHRAVSRAENVTDEFIEGPPGWRKGTSEPMSQARVQMSDRKSKVFIVHGHDEAAQNKVARFIERMGFEAIILHENPSSGRTVIEKIEHYSDVGFAVVLYTPDDVGNVKAKAEDLNLRARQNVVFEHGYLIAKLKRQNVAAIVDGDIELPNDISGVVYIKLDEASAWKLTLAKEMRESGFEIDMNKLI